jgi:hypothetical protein
MTLIIKQSIECIRNIIESVIIVSQNRVMAAKKITQAYADAFCVITPIDGSSK